ncbi:MAG: hypothetical protein F6K19_04985 [Cyanothece sp. SIO1E1]|nr:hypothetical protein [Cyanothece sp. SIO1E1]
MSNPHAPNEQTPLLELFLMLREAGMALTLEQYDLLRQALEQGYGFYDAKGWDALRRTCRLLWVKPNPNYDAVIFERTFDRYVRKQRQKLKAASELTEPVRMAQPSSAKVLPQVPPRRIPSSQASGDKQAPVAIKTAPPPLRSSGYKKKYQLIPTDLPIALQSIQTSWCYLRRPVREGTEYELDLEGTLEQICRDGFFSGIVLQPVLKQRAELLLLIDDSNAMLPFRPALQPLVEAIAHHHITPAQIYRFTGYPEAHLYPWRQPTKAKALDIVLSRLHRNHTVVLIVSDAGAAMGRYSEQRIQGTAVFLERLTPCIRQVLWLNPLPYERWHGTSAQAIAHFLDGGMVTLDAVSLQAAARLPSLGTIIKLW